MCWHWDVRYPRNGSRVKCPDLDWLIQICTGRDETLVFTLKWESSGFKAHLSSDCEESVCLFVLIKLFFSTGHTHEGKVSYRLHNLPTHEGLFSLCRCGVVFSALIWETVSVWRTLTNIFREVVLKLAFLIQWKESKAHLSYSEPRQRILQSSVFVL